MQGATYEQLQFEFGVSYRTVKDMRSRLSLPPRVAHNRQVPAVPNDWFEVAPTMYKRELQRYYAMTRLQIDRLVEQTGITTRALLGPPKPIRAMVDQKAILARGSFKQFIHKRTPDIAPGVPSAAAQYLRRYYPNVHRCDLPMTETTAETWGDRHGIPNRGKGRYFVAGVGVISELELVNLALDKGFEPVSAD